MIGESWFGVEEISNSPFATDNQAQPEPKRVFAALANCSLNASNEPNLASIAAANSPSGAPLPFGVSKVQNNEWFA